MDKDNIQQELNMDELINSITKLGYSGPTENAINYFEPEYEQNWETESDNTLTSINIAVEEISESVKDLIDQSIDTNDRVGEIETALKNVQSSVKSLSERIDAIGMAVAESQKYNSAVINLLGYVNHVLFAQYGPVNVKSGTNVFSVSPHGSKLVGKSEAGPDEKKDE